MKALTQSDVRALAIELAQSANPLDRAIVEWVLSQFIQLMADTAATEGGAS